MSIHNLNDIHFLVLKERCFGCKWIKNLRIVQLIMRYKDALLALWLWADVLLDVRMTRTYYNLSFGENGTWEEYHPINGTNDGPIEHLSTGYFYGALTSWILPPTISAVVIYPLWFLGGDWNGNVDMVNYLLQKSCCDKRLPDSSSINIVYKFALFVLVLPLHICILAIGVFITAIGIYVLIPLGAIATGLSIVYYKDAKEIKNETLRAFHKYLPFLKLFEHAGEAVPQLVLSLVFYTNNKDFVDESETYYGINVSITVISIIFSTGSTLFGLVQGIKLFVEECL